MPKAIERERIGARIQGERTGSEAKLSDYVERDARFAAPAAERSVIFVIARHGARGSATAQKLIRELDLIEIRCRA